MAFIHNETTATRKVLQYTGNKGVYVDSPDVLKGHLKPVSLNDRNFNLEGISGTAYKFTMKLSKTDTVSLEKSDKLFVDGVSYTVQDAKRFFGIKFDTYKILLSTK